MSIPSQAAGGEEEEEEIGGGDDFAAAIPSSSTFLGGNDDEENASQINQSLVAIDLMDETAEGNGGDDDEEYWTASELLRELTKTFLNEAAAPKLLPEKLDLVDKLREHAGEIARIMRRNPNKQSLTHSAHKMELCRIEYVINSYLRTRLKKIEQSPAQCLQEHSERLRRALAALRVGKPLEQQAELLDKREVEFAQDLQKANASLFADTFLKQLPPSLQWMPLAWNNWADKSRVFIEVLKDGLDDVPVPNLADPNSELLLRLEKGSRHLTPFNCISGLLERGDVCLL